MAPVAASPPKSALARHGSMNRLHGPRTFGRNPGSPKKTVKFHKTDEVIQYDTLTPEIPEDTWQNELNSMQTCDTDSEQDSPAHRAVPMGRPLPSIPPFLIPSKSDSLPQNQPQALQSAISVPSPKLPVPQEVPMVSPLLPSPVLPDMADAPLADEISGQRLPLDKRIGALMDSIEPFDEALKRSHQHHQRHQRGGSQSSWGSQSSVVMESLSYQRLPTESPEPDFDFQQGISDLPASVQRKESLLDSQRNPATVSVSRAAIPAPQSDPTLQRTYSKRQAELMRMLDPRQGGPGLSAAILEEDPAEEETVDAITSPRLFGQPTPRKLSGSSEGFDFEQSHSIDHKLHELDLGEDSFFRIVQNSGPGNRGSIVEPEEHGIEISKSHDALLSDVAGNKLDSGQHAAEPDHAGIHRDLSMNFANVMKEASQDSLPTVEPLHVQPSAPEQPEIVKSSSPTPIETEPVVKQTAAETNVHEEDSRAPHTPDLPDSKAFNENRPGNDIPKSDVSVESSPGSHSAEKIPETIEERSPNTELPVTSLAKTSPLVESKLDTGNALEVAVAPKSPAGTNVHESSEVSLPQLSLASEPSANETSIEEKRAPQPSIPDQSSVIDISHVPVYEPSFSDYDREQSVQEPTARELSIQHLSLPVLGLPVPEIPRSSTVEVGVSDPSIPDQSSVIDISHVPVYEPSFSDYDSTPVRLDADLTEVSVVGEQESRSSVESNEISASASVSNPDSFVDHSFATQSLASESMGSQSSQSIASLSSESSHQSIALAPAESSAIQETREALSSPDPAPLELFHDGSRAITTHDLDEEVSTPEDTPAGESETHVVEDESDDIEPSHPGNSGDVTQSTETDSDLHVAPALGESDGPELDQIEKGQNSFDADPEWHRSKSPNLDSDLSELNENESIENIPLPALPDISNTPLTFDNLQSPQWDSEAPQIAGAGSSASSPSRAIDVASDVTPEHEYQGHELTLMNTANTDMSEIPELLEALPVSVDQAERAVSVHEHDESDPSWRTESISDTAKSPGQADKEVELAPVSPSQSNHEHAVANTVDESSDYDLANATGVMAIDAYDNAERERRDELEENLNRWSAMTVVTARSTLTDLGDPMSEIDTDLDRVMSTRGYGENGSYTLRDNGSLVVATSPSKVRSQNSVIHRYSESNPPPASMSSLGIAPIGPRPPKFSYQSFGSLQSRDIPMAPPPVHAMATAASESTALNIPASTSGNASSMDVPRLRPRQSLIPEVSELPESEELSDRAEIAPQANLDSTQETTHEAVSEPIREPIKETIREPIRQPIRDPAIQASAGNAKESGIDRDILLDRAPSLVLGAASRTRPEGEAMRMWLTKARKMPKVVKGEKGRLYVKFGAVRDLAVTGLDKSYRYALTLDNGVHCISTSHKPVSEGVDEEYGFAIGDDMEDEITGTFRVTSRGGVPTNAQIGSDGSFAKFVLKPSKLISTDIARKTIWCANDWSKTGGQGCRLDYQALWVPRLSMKETLPGSMAKAMAEISEARKQQSVVLRGDLVQCGGDCPKQGKRRWFVLDASGKVLVAHSEKSHRPRTIINLGKAIQTLQLGAREFSIEFRRGEELLFTDCDATTWIKAIESVRRDGRSRKPYLNAVLYS